MNDLGRLRTAAESVDAVIHAAFNHDFLNLQEHRENDRKVISTLGEVLTGSDRPLIITSGTGLVRAVSLSPANPVPGSMTGSLAMETGVHITSTEFPRAATEEAAGALIAGGVRVMLMRSPQVHDTSRFGRITQHIQLAREKGWVAYIGEGRNRLPAVHVSDAAKLFRLALENGQAGARSHAVAEERIALRDIAKAIGA